MGSLSFFFSGCRPHFARLAASPLPRACIALTKSEEKERLLAVYVNNSATFFLIILFLTLLDAVIGTVLTDVINNLLPLEIIFVMFFLMLLASPRSWKKCVLSYTTFSPLCRGLYDPI